MTATTFRGSVAAWNFIRTTLPRWYPWRWADRWFTATVPGRRASSEPAWVGTASAMPIERASTAPTKLPRPSTWGNAVRTDATLSTPWTLRTRRAMSVEKGEFTTLEITNCDVRLRLTAASMLAEAEEPS